MRRHSGSAACAMMLVCRDDRRGVGLRSGGMQRIVIRNATIITMDPKIGDLRGGDNLLDGKRIAEVRRDIGPVDDAEVIDADRHDRTPRLRRQPPPYLAVAAALRGRRLDPRPVFRRHPRRHGQALHARRMYIANYSGALEALDAGITTLYDWSHNNNTPDHADEAVHALKDSGIRAVYGYGNASDEWVPVSELPTNFADVERVRRTHSPPTTSSSPWPSPPADRSSPPSTSPRRISAARALSACGSPSMSATACGASTGRSSSWRAAACSARRHLCPLQHALRAGVPAHRR